MGTAAYRTLVVAIVLGAAVGCASTKDLDAVRAQAEAAQAAADQAQATADQALGTAQAGQSCCDATNEKIDRMFKQSMMK